MSRHQKLALVAIAGLSYFLYQVAGILSKINDWSVIWNPPTVAQLLSAVAGALVAIGAALGIDIRKLIGNGNA